MPYQLRYYQQEAHDAIWSEIRAGNMAPLVCLPTGSGKSALVAELVRTILKWKGSALIVVHVKELVQQLSDSILSHCGDDTPIGVYSAGLGKKEVDQITVAGIQSIYRKGCDIGKRDVLIIDEAHLQPPDGDGMYRSLIKAMRIVNPNLRIIGLTATPYRLNSGLVYGDDQPFQSIAYDAGVKNLIDQGYLSKLRGKNGGDPDLAGVHRRGGDFILSELELAMTDEDKIKHAVDEMIRHGSDRKAWLVFCCGVTHAHMVSEEINSRGIESCVVSGETPTAERDELIARYKAGDLRCLTNCAVLTTGFDAPHVDMVVMLRPTESPGLYYQIVGRGLRRCDGKEDCLILDLAGNIARHGPIDRLNDSVLAKATGKKEGTAPTKTCPECEEVIFAGLRMCPACGYEFPRELARHETKASDLSPVSSTEIRWSEVTAVEYQEWEKRGADANHPKTLRVDYWCGYTRVGSEWVCVEHDGFAGNKARLWLTLRLRPGWEIDDGQIITPECDTLALTAANIAQLGLRALRCPSRIGLQQDGKYERVERYEWDETPEPGSDLDEEPDAELVGSWLALDDEPPF